MTVTPELQGDVSHHTCRSDTVDPFTRDGCGGHGMRGDWQGIVGEGASSVEPVPYLRCPSVMSVWGATSVDTGMEGIAVQGALERAEAGVDWRSPEHGGLGRREQTEVDMRQSSQRGHMSCFNSEASLVSHVGCMSWAPTGST